jgi:ribonuclease J
VGRKVVVTGRSMVTITRVARELGYLHISNDDIIDAYEVDDIPDNKIVVLCTGSQGEPLSALSRMANGEHKSLSITARDTVIISATPVPGNEKSVAGIVNALSKIGCSIYDKNEALVHVSGHGNQEELKLMLTMVKPKYFMPVHGEAIHLRAHAKLARAVGIPEKNIFVLDNGDTLELRNHTVRIGEPVDSGVVYVDGLSVTDADPVVLRDRQKLSKDGIVTCVVTVSHRSHKTRAIEIYSRGVSFANDEELNKDAQEVVRTRIDRSSEADVGVDQLRKGIRNGLSNFLWSRTHTRPMVIPVVMEV